VSLWGSPLLSGLLAGSYLGLISLMWLGLVLSVRGWGRGYRLSLPDEPAPSTGPRVSICIPARNEAHNIALAVRAALSTQWPDLEVIVVDDRSSDDTGVRASEAGSGDSRIRVIQGTEPPPGWSGKAWALTRAAGEATGSVLLFVDADVQVHPRAVQGLVREAESRQLALLSAFGTWTLVSFWERALIPAVGWLIRGSVDFRRVNQPGRPEAFANGQLIMVDRVAYDEMGGHDVVKAEVLDDVRLAEAFKRRGYRIGLMAAEWAFSVRLYRSLSEIIAGYSKNLYEGMGRRPGIGLGAILFIFVGTLFPFALLLASVVTQLVLGWNLPPAPWIAWIGGICMLQFVFRWRLDRRDGRSGADAWTHPFANMILVWILIRSVLGVESEWKGRRFVDGRVAACDEPD
jgi:chlorobactene glucosyltransferase